MSSAYTYTNTDFTNSSSDVDPGELTATINSLNLATSLLYINSDVESNGTFSVELNFAGALSNADKSTLDSTIAAYTTQKYLNLFAKLTDSRSVATNGGTFTAGAWQTRTLNTLAGSQNFVSLSNNQFTMQSGTYSLQINAVSNNVQNNQLRLYDITNSAVVDVSISSYSSNTNSLSSLILDLTIATSTTYEIQHCCNATQADIGFGRASGFGENEVYLTILIQKHL